MPVLAEFLGVFERKIEGGGGGGRGGGFVRFREVRKIKYTKMMWCYL